MEEEGSYYPRVEVDERVVDTQLELEEKDKNKEAAISTAVSSKASSARPDQVTLGRKIIRFDDKDPLQPNNWSQV